jgi:hypothetical protein
MIAHDRTRLTGQLGCQAEQIRLGEQDRTAATLRDRVAAVGMSGLLN